MPNTVEELIINLGKEIPAKMREYNIPGMAYSIISKEGIDWIECFGYTDTSQMVAVDKNTLFSLQSTTKSVTSVAFLLAVQDDHVGLDDSIVDHVPEFYVNSRFDIEKHLHQKLMVNHFYFLQKNDFPLSCFLAHLDQQTLFFLRPDNRQK